MSKCCIVFFLVHSLAGATGAPWHLHLLPEAYAKERGSKCLDHSPAGYYVRNQDPTKWVIFLEGGGLCVEPIDCLARLKSAQGSSKYLKPDQPPTGGMTTADTDLNPFQNFSQVFVPYCSGDTWLGNSDEGHKFLLGMQMSGHLIIEAVVDVLLNTTSLGSATDAIFTGTSAGGIGVYHHADWFAGKLASYADIHNHAAPRTAAFPIEGMFFPKNFPVEFPQFALGNRHAISDFMSKYLNLLQYPWLHPGCVEAAKKEKFPEQDCFSISKMFKYTKTPMFMGMNRFDLLMIEIIGLCPPNVCKPDSSPKSAAGQYIRFFGDCVNDSVTAFSQSNPSTAFFITSNFHHDENFYQFFYHTEKIINGVSLRSAFEDWYWGGKKVELLEQTCNSNGPCGPKQSGSEHTTIDVLV